MIGCAIVVDKVFKSKGEIHEQCAVSLLDKGRHELVVLCPRGWHFRMINWRIRSVGISGLVNSGARVCVCVCVCVGVRIGVCMEQIELRAFQGWSVLVRCDAQTES